MIEAVYVDAKKSKSIVAIKPKPPFKPVFQMAASREGSDIRILNEPLNGSSLFRFMNPLNNKVIKLHFKK